MTLRQITALIPPERAWGLWVSRQIVARIMDPFGPSLAGTRVEQVDTVLPDGRRVVGEWVYGRSVDDRADRAIYFLHGSGYAMCSPRTHRRLTAWLSKLTGLPVFCVDYRLAPRHRFPTAADDVRAGWDWLRPAGLPPERIVIAGDSAGGHLAVDLLLQPDVATPAAVVLFSPLVDLTFALARTSEAASPRSGDPRARCRPADRVVLRRNDPAHPRLTLDVAGGRPLPPTLIQAGGAEMLAADARTPRRRDPRRRRQLRTAGLARPGARLPGPAPADPRSGPPCATSRSSSQPRCAPTPSIEQRDEHHGPLRIVAQAKPQREPRWSPAPAAGSARLSRSNSPAAAAGSSAATSTKHRARATADAITDRAARRSPCAATCHRSTTSAARRTGTGLVRRSTDPGDQQRRRRRRRHAHRRDRLDDWEWTLGINLWGVIHGCHVFTPILREAGLPGGIINVASAAAFGAAPGMAAYNVSKAGVLSLSETLAAELSGTGVSVTVLCPTFVKTNIVESGRKAGHHRQVDAARRPADALDRVVPRAVARTCLDTHDRGGLYCMPQLDAKIGWGIKRFTPRVHPRRRAHSARVDDLGGS